MDDLSTTNKNLKKNIELDLLNKNLTGTDSNTPSLQSLKNTVADTISGLDKTDRLLPGLQSSKGNTCDSSQINSQMSKIGKYGWLQSKILDLEKIDQVVKNDFKDIQTKLSKLNKKIASSNMTNTEAAILKNDISSIQQNQLGIIPK
jgi:hypothetical protein